MEPVRYRRRDSGDVGAPCGRGIADDNWKPVPSQVDAGEDQDGGGDLGNESCQCGDPPGQHRTGYGGDHGDKQQDGGGAGGIDGEDEEQPDETGCRLGLAMTARSTPKVHDSEAAA